MKYILFSLAVCFGITANGQIIGPDTAVVGANVQFSTNYQSPFYSWSPDTVNIDQAINPGSFATVVNTGMSTTVFTTINYDNGNYYSFLISYSTNNVYKLSYGTSPLNTPTLTSLGTFGLNTGQTDGIDIAKDSVTGNWYAFVLGGTQFLRLDFGTSLANTPTATMMTYPANLAWPHQIFLKKEGPQWMLFVANRSGGISRFDFGNSLSNTPVGVNLPSVGGINQPVGFFLYKQTGNWYMIVLNLIDATLTRVDFGTNLQNNTPTGTNIGNPGNYLNLPRGSSLLAGCDKLIGYILIESGNLIKLDFQNDITNPAPVATNIGSTGVGSNNNLVSFVYNDSLYWLRTHTGSELYRTKVLTYPAGSTSGFAANTYSHTFTQPGIYDLNLHCGQGAVQGPGSFCKQIVVLDSTTSVKETTSHSIVSVYPNPNTGLFSISGKINSQADVAEIYITDILGKVVFKDNTNTKNTVIEKQIDIRNVLTPGMYFLKIVTPDYQETISFIKQ